MAKKSAVNRNLRVQALVKQYAAKRDALKAIAVDESLPLEERFEARLKLAELPRNSSKTRIRNRCQVTGRPRAYYRKLKMSRISLRDLGSAGLIPGLVMTAMMMATVAFYAHRNGWGSDTPFSWKQLGEATLEVAIVLAFPVVVWLMMKAGVDRLEALLSAFDAVRRGGTVSIVGVYGGAADPLPMFQMFDKQVQVRMGQANVRAWTDDILALLNKDEDVLGVETFATHHLSLDEAPDAYETFQKKQDGAVKIVFRP